MMRLVILHPSLQMLLIFSLLLNPRPRRVLSSFPSHISSGACLGSSSPSCTILNSSFCGEEPDDNNDDLRLIRRLSSDLKIDILSRIIHKLKLRPLRRILWLWCHVWNSHESVIFSKIGLWRCKSVKCKIS